MLSLTLPLAMMVTTSTFLIGGLADRYVCQSFEHLDRLEEVTHNFLSKIKIKIKKDNLLVNE